MLQRKIKIVTVFGTRPDAIKMAPVVNDLKRYPEKVDLKIVVTGQHREMLEQVLSVFEIVPDHDLNIMQPRQSLFDITTRILSGMEALLKDEQTDMVIAQGDTTTTFAAGLAAFYHKAVFGHVEAGLRTDNKYDPFPEEINRRLASQLADLHFAPTDLAKANLLKEDIPEKQIVVAGNTVIDALLATADKSYKFDNSELTKAAASDRMILVTAHRRENWGEPMHDICRAIKRILEEHPDVNVIFPVHRNPIVRETVFPELENEARVLLIEPPDYVPFVHLMKSAHLILSDSGGVQEEAPSLGKPVLVLRKTTERPEGIAAGSAKLVGTDPDEIVAQASQLLNDSQAYTKMAQVKNPYGDGRAAERITEAIFAYFQ